MPYHTNKLDPARLAYAVEQMEKRRRPKALQDSRPWIYFIRCDDQIKIGISRAPRRRLNIMQVGNPTPLSLLATMPADAFTERRLHLKFSALRVRREWFTAAPELLDYIDSIRSRFPQAESGFPQVFNR